MSKKRIAIITSGQPSVNPRLVKEADSLCAAGYEVTVLYAYWNEWGTRYDRDLLASKKWKAIRVGGDPKQKRFTWILSRLINKIARKCLQKNGNFKWLADVAIARSAYFLAKAAKRYPADLYIAHNLGALPAVGKAAALHQKPYAFDAEDFHRQEISDDPSAFHCRLCSYIEDKYLPGAAYITASSPLIAGQYQRLYKRDIATLRNVFPKTECKVIDNMQGPLRLFWFSQTIGPDRGLEPVIEALGLSNADLELHLLGMPSPGYTEQLTALARENGVRTGVLHFHEPIKSDDIFKLAPEFDIGLAAETGLCLNRNIALTNKVFTYLQCGLAVAASNTRAQTDLLDLYPQAGKIYASAHELAEIIDLYDQNRGFLHQTKKKAYQIGQAELNWNEEDRILLNTIKKVLSE